jgi:hypothetical protein
LRSGFFSTAALAALAGAQLGQMLLIGSGPQRPAPSVGSAAVLAGEIQTPGVSGFSGCTDRADRVGIAAGGAAAGSLLGTAQLRVQRPELSDQSRP